MASVVLVLYSKMFQTVLSFWYLMNAIKSATAIADSMATPMMNTHVYGAKL